MRISGTGGEVQCWKASIILKFHKDGEKPIVKVRCTEGDGLNLQTVIEDNGIGFDEQHAERFFSPFQRRHGRSSPYEGTGMGLAICMKIVERHGGVIKARSLPGEGSLFLIDLHVMRSGLESAMPGKESA